MSVWRQTYDAWRERFLTRAGEARATRPALHRRMILAVVMPPKSEDEWHQARATMLGLIHELEHPGDYPEPPSAAEQAEQDMTAAAIEEFSDLNFPEAPAGGLAPEPTIKQLATLPPVKFRACQEYAKLLVKNGSQRNEKEAFRHAWRVLSPRWEPATRKSEPKVPIMQAEANLPWPPEEAALIEWFKTVPLPSPPITFLPHRTISNPELWRTNTLERLARGKGDAAAILAMADLRALKAWLAQPQAKAS